MQTSWNHQKSYQAIVLWHLGIHQYLHHRHTANGLLYHRCGVRKHNIWSSRWPTISMMWYYVLIPRSCIFCNFFAKQNLRQNLRQSTWTWSDGSNNSRSTKCWRKCFDQPSRSFLKFDQWASILRFIGDETIENVLKALPSFDKSSEKDEWVQ